MFNRSVGRRVYVCAGKREKIKRKREQRGERQGVGGNILLRHSKSKEDGVEVYPLSPVLSAVALACLLIS